MIFSLSFIFAYRAARSVVFLITKCAVSIPRSGGSDNRAGDDGYEGVLQPHGKSRLPAKNSLDTTEPSYRWPYSADTNKIDISIRSGIKYEKRWCLLDKDTIKLETKAPAKKRNIHNATTFSVFQSSNATLSANNATCPVILVVKTENPESPQHLQIMPLTPGKPQV